MSQDELIAVADELIHIMDRLNTLGDKIYDERGCADAFFTIRKAKTDLVNSWNQITDVAFKERKGLWWKGESKCQ